MRSSDRCEILGHLAVGALLAELELFPKPGLVSPMDSGSHRDMDYALLRASAESLREPFQELAEAGASGAAFTTHLVPIGLRAERRMLDVTGGVNTHRGAIFAMGLLVAGTACAGEQADDSQIRETLLARWGADLNAHIARGASSPAHGSVARRLTGAGGAREEAARGFPSLFDLALPHFRKRLDSGLSHENAALETLFLLIGHVGDTNLIHRGGETGGAFARQRAASFLEAGGMSNPSWKILALKIHREFVEKNLSPGGAADLLTGTLFLHEVTRGATEAVDFPEALPLLNSWP